MREPDFLALRQRLLQRGLDRRYAKRLAEELAGHYEDLRLEARSAGVGPDGIEDFAAERLGSVTDIAAAVEQRSELRSWCYRYPQVARIALPLAFAALLPAAPLIAGINHAESVLRWSCCAVLSAFFTALLLLCLQLSIALA